MINLLKLKFLLPLLIITHSLPQYHPSFLKEDLNRFVHSYSFNQTSQAFSIIMNIFLKIQIYQKQPWEENILTGPKGDFSCEKSLQTMVDFVKNIEEKENFSQVYILLQKLVSFCTSLDFHPTSLSKYSPYNCAACVVLTRIFENYISIHSKNITDFIQKQVCDLFDGVLRPTCEAFVHYFGPALINGLINRAGADEICLKVGLCTNQKCRIKSGWVRQEIYVDEQSKPAPWNWIIDLFIKSFQNHTSPFDFDNDSFSDISTFRGYNWKGADCDEFNSNIYPGRKEGSELLDHDCNGIFGIDLVKRESYEKLFCSNSTRLGVAVIGDSAGAHFSIPEKYFNASMIKKGTYSDLLERAANEMDIPHESGYTGNVNVPLRHSIYKEIRKWNLCNNNDYQNIAVNGAYSQITFNYAKNLKRDQKKDHPMLIFLELVGNDVCAKSFSRMTNTTRFKSNILRILHQLDSTVPAGSHVVLLGLADGQLLYDYLHDWAHPLNVTYRQVYDFLNCLNVSPCWGWLNSNDTVRRFTNDRAKNLTKVYEEILQEKIEFKNFDYDFYDFPVKQIIDRKIMEGGDPKELIERCDGFHPNGDFHSYLSDWLWKKIKDDHSEWIGQKNPFNNEIKRVFKIKDLE